MEISKKYILLSFITLLIYALAINEWNIHLIKKENPANFKTNNRCLVYNSSVYSVDNDWYVPQIKNFLSGQGFTIDPRKYHYNVRRSPVYPIFYGIHYILFGETGSYFFIRFSQLLIYVLGVIALFFAALNFTGSKKIAGLTAVLYGFNPTTVSFLYFTITESLSPSLVCFLLYFLSLCKKYNRKKDWLAAGLLFALGSLCRPPIFFSGFSILFLAIYLNKNDFRKFISGSVFFAIGACLLFIPYTVRNYVVTKGEYIVLERYYGDPMGYGLPNIALRQWISCWMNPADYSSENISNTMKTAICCDSTKTKKMVIDREMKNLPARATLVNSRNDIRKALSALYDYYALKDKTPVPQSIDSIENDCMGKIKKLKEDFIRRAPFQYYVITPLLIIKSVIFQSNSAPIVFLDNYQGNIFKIAIKALLLLLNIWMFFSLLGNVFVAKKYAEIYFMTLLYVVANFVYITFDVKYFEARYLIPLFPGLIILCAIFLIEATALMRKRLHF